jgi:hypothetical protein
MTEVACERRESCVIISPWNITFVLQLLKIFKFRYPLFRALYIPSVIPVLLSLHICSCLEEESDNLKNAYFGGCLNLRSCRIYLKER